MANYMKFDPPKSKMIMEKSVFDNPQSRHEHYVKDHHFNYAVSDRRDLKIELNYIIFMIMMTWILMSLDQIMRCEHDKA